jgi:hypothetical protein
MSVNSVADLVEPVRLQQLATPANYRMGQGIAASGAVELDEFGPLKVTARTTSGNLTPDRIDIDTRGSGVSLHLLGAHCATVQACRRRGPCDMGESTKTSPALEVVRGGAVAPTPNPVFARPLRHKRAAGIQSEA